MSEQSMKDEQEQAPGRHEGHLPKAKRSKGLMVATSLVVVLGVACGVTVANQRGAEQAQQTQIVKLKDTVALERDKAVRQVSEDMNKDLGISSTRLLKDEQMLRELLGTAFNWNSGESYENARETLQRRYKVPEDSEFLTAFLPPSKFNEDGAGKRYYWLDSIGLNAKIDESKAQIDVASVSGSTYVYLVSGTLEYSSDFTDTTAKDGGLGNAEPRANRQVLLEVTVQGDGSLGSVTGIPASGQTKST